MAADLTNFGPLINKQTADLTNFGPLTNKQTADLNTKKGKEGEEEGEEICSPCLLDGVRARR